MNGHVILCGLTPRMAALLVPGVAAAVYAMTPAGDRVHLARCCERGHESLAGAIAHAAAIGDKIEAKAR